MRSIFNELRILASDLLIHKALWLMPRDAAERKPLKDALDGYVQESAQIARWQKFPA